MNTNYFHVFSRIIFTGNYPIQSVVESAVSNDLPAFASYLGDHSFDSILTLILLIISGSVFYYLYNKVNAMKTSENKNESKIALYKFAYIFMFFATSYIFLSFIAQYVSLCENCQELARLYGEQAGLLSSEPLAFTYLQQAFSSAVIQGISTSIAQGSGVTRCSVNIPNIYFSIEEGEIVANTVFTNAFDIFCYSIIYPFKTLLTIHEFFYAFNSLVCIMYTCMFISILLLFIYFIISIQLRRTLTNEDKLSKSIFLSKKVVYNNGLSFVSVFIGFYVSILVLVSIYIYFYCYPNSIIGQVCDSSRITPEGVVKPILSIWRGDTPVDYLYKFLSIVLGFSLSFYRSFSLVKPLKWRGFSKPILMFVLSIISINFTSFMVNDVVDINKVYIGITVKETFIIHSIILEIILISGLCLAILMMVEQAFIKVFKVDINNNEQPSISKVLLVFIRLLKGICLFYIFMAAYYINLHLYGPSLFKTFPNFSI